jgi:hypothetical protein
VWLHPRALARSVRTGWVPDPAVSLALERLAQAGRPEEDATALADDDPDYEDWIEQVEAVRQATVRRYALAGLAGCLSIDEARKLLSAQAGDRRPGRAAPAPAEPNFDSTSQLRQAFCRSDPMTTAFPAPSDQVHIYIDESGLLHGEPHEMDLPQVGGVVLFGDAAAVDGALLDLLRQSTEQAGGVFPHDLHTRHAALRRWIIGELRARLATWPRAPELLSGAVIRHGEDLASEGGALTSEARADNRYQRMLIDLLQHLLFVAPGLRERLTPQAEVFFHLASRKGVFQPGQATRA